MEPIQFLAGSQYFFGQYPEYVKHDTDYVVLCDNIDLPYAAHDIDTNSDYFYWPIHTKEWHINYLLQPNSFGLDIGHLLIPEVAQFLGITIDMLKQLDSLFDLTEQQVGPFYNYNKIIFEAYLANNDFILTEDQRWQAFRAYQAYRLDIYPEVSK